MLFIAFSARKSVVQSWPLSKTEDAIILRVRTELWFSPAPRRGKSANLHSVFSLDSPLPPVYVRLNIKTLFLRLWARISRKLAGKPQQMELDLWTRRSSR